MKKIYCIILILGAFYCNSAFSQSTVYHPFPENYGRWVMSITDNAFGAPNNESWDQYVTSGDTIINSTTYKKVTVAHSSMPYTWITIAGYVPYEPSTYSFAYRNDIPNKKVYIFDTINGIETDTLWYDFNLNIGDTLNPIGMYSLEVGAPIIVDSIDSVEICNVYHKRFKFQPEGAAGDPVYTSLIEGVGFSANFIQSDENQFFPRLLSGVPYDYYTNFYCTPTSIDEFKAPIGQLELFPNPAENTLQIRLTEKNSFLLQDYSIIDCIGRVVFSGSITDNNIDVSMLEKGLYVLRIEDKKKNILQGKFVKQ